MDRQSSTFQVGPALSAKAIDARYEKAEPNILTQVSIVLTPGELVCVVGPNGSGKSTLIHALSRTMAPESGAVLLDQSDLYNAISARDAARSIGVVPQTTEVFLDFSVRDTVAMGRAPWRESRGILAADSSEDESAVDQALAQMEISEALSTRPISHVSGGERQRALVARMLAQNARIMLLDEPTAALDLSAQSRLMHWLRIQANREGRAVMVVLHDLNLAATYADRMVVVHKGRVVADGPPSRVLTARTIADVYGVSTWVRANPLSDRPTVLPIPSEIGEITGAKLSGRTIHLLCGGGSGAGLMFRLARFGSRISAGLLHERDSDAEAAQALGIAFTPVKEFSHPSADAIHAHLDTAAQADGAILTRVSIGATNAAIVDAAIAFATTGRPLVVIRGETDRDKIESRLKQMGSVKFASTDDEAISMMNEALSEGDA